MYPRQNQSYTFTFIPLVNKNQVKDIKHTCIHDHTRGMHIFSSESTHQFTKGSPGLLFYDYQHGTSCRSVSPRPGSCRCQYELAATIGVEAPSTPLVLCLSLSQDLERAPAFYHCVGDLYTPMGTRSRTSTKTHLDWCERAYQKAFICIMPP